ncbi:MAG TPA: acyltransferase [Trinickia sp.]|jgi:peptidoglycan/LPS O-acetylase OafA/YrhL|uniref:acyltransferase family protein n=1 Tax=Trinickia sp. TaxID=2571163 RepID=UPI002F42FE1A
MSDSSIFPVSATAPAAAPTQRIDAVRPAAAAKETFIDAMRGMAALLVAYFHCRQVAWVGLHHFHQAMGFSLAPSVLLGYLTMPIAWGSAGVSIFFVISGYCIHRNPAARLAADPAYRLDAPIFWARRFARIYPVLFAALLLTLAFDSISLSLPPVNHKILSIGPKAFLISLLSLQGVLAHPYGSNGALWTLAIEVQFYVVYPLLFAARRRFGMPAVMAVIAAINVISGYLLEPVWIYFFTSYWFSWTLGAYLAERRVAAADLTLTRRQTLCWRLAAAALAVLGCAIFNYSVYIGQYIAFQLWAIAFACLMRTTLTAENEAVPLGNGSFLMRALARCGLFSYSLYVIHLPIFICLQAVFFRSALQLSILPTFAFMPVAIGAACLFYLCVERPAMRWSSSIRRRRPNVEQPAAA